jgi:hypothetical protein
LQAGDDLDRVSFFALQSLPEDLAFPTDRLVLSELFLSKFPENQGPPDR